MFKLGEGVYDKKLKKYGYVKSTDGMTVMVTYGSVDVGYHSTGFLIAEGHTYKYESKSVIDKNQYGRMTFRTEKDYTPRLRRSDYV